MEHVSIAVGLYNVRDDLKADFEGTLKKVADMGYDGVEFAGNFGGRSAAEIRSLCEKYGLCPLAAHIPLPELMEDIRLLDFYKEIGIQYAVIPILPPDYRRDGEKYGDFVAFAKTLCVEAEKRGLVPCYHNHDFEFKRFDGQCAMDLLLEEVPALQTEFDTGWVQIGGADPVAYLEKYKARSPIMQFKDFRGKKIVDVHPKDCPGFGFFPVGYGELKSFEIMQKVKELEIPWVIVEQDWSPAGTTDMECQKMSLDFLRNLDQMC